MTVKRYSGRATVSLRLDDWDNYHYSVSVGGKVKATGTTRPPKAGFGRGVAYDSAEAYDRTAHAALGFAMADDSSGDVIGAVDYDPSGQFSITRAKPTRTSTANGGPLKRTKRACSMRGKQTRTGSSKAASRLSTHCPRRAAKNGSAARTPDVGDAIHYYLIPFGFAPTDGPHEATVERVYWNPSSRETLVDARLLGVHAGSMARSIPYHGSPSAIPSGEGRYRWWAWPSDAKKFARKASGRAAPKRRSAKNCGY